MRHLLILLRISLVMWNNFLDSLATVGGNIFILLVLWVLSCGGVMHVLHHGITADNQDARNLVLSTFSGVSGALMYALTQRQKGGGSNGDAIKPRALDGKE